MGASAKLQTLAPPRHDCHACGNCCFGWRVRLVDDGEMAHIEEVGRALGVERPVEDHALRFHKGACVFLDTDRLCRIHKAYGLEAKPLTCQQFPLRLTSTRTEVRVGVDPGCASTHLSWRDGPLLAVTPLVAPQPRRVGARAVADEDALLGLLGVPGLTLAGAFGAVAGAPREDGELPTGMAGRIVARLKASRLERILQKEVMGSGLRDPLAHVARHIDALDPDAPPAWAGALSAELDAFAIDAIRRQVFLRLGHADLPPVGQLLVLGAGVLACAWADPGPERFGPAYASWARLARMRALWGGLMPRPETARWLIHGDDEG